MTEGLCKSDCIRTFSGIDMNVFDPKPQMIKVEDIAHALSHQCRFSGHMHEFYSVAQHAVNCSNITIKDGEPSFLQEQDIREMNIMELRECFQRLNHDDSEAYLVDIPTPIKSKLDNYKEIEDNLMKALSQTLNFDYPLSEQTKQVDKFMLEMEWQHLVISNTGLIKIYTHNEAKEAFLKQFNLLTTLIQMQELN